MRRLFRSVLHRGLQFRGLSELVVHFYQFTVCQDDRSAQRKQKRRIKLLWFQFFGRFRLFYHLYYGARPESCFTSPDNPILWSQRSHYRRYSSNLGTMNEQKSFPYLLPITYFSSFKTKVALIILAVSSPLSIEKTNYISGHPFWLKIEWWNN